MMLLNYFITTLRVLIAHKMQFFFNVTGLAVGLAGALLVSYYVKFELSYDQFHPGFEQTYKLSQRYNGDGQGISESQKAQFYASAAMLDALEGASEVLDVFTLFPLNDVIDDHVTIGESTFLLESTFAASPNITQFIALDVISGNLNQALTQPDTIALSRSEAFRLFGRVNVTGETMMNKSGRWTVGAVFRDLPQNTHFKFKSLSMQRPFEDKHVFYMNWGAIYLKLADGSDLSLLEQSFNQFVTERAENPWVVGIMTLSQLHLKSENTQTTINMSILLSILLVVIAGFNYINMSTALAGKRAKEVGVRKALGATKVQLVTQFLLESIVIALVASLFAGVLAVLALPWFNELVELQLSLNFFGELGVILLLIALLVGTLAGLYPALFLSSFDPKRVLGGDLTVGSSAALIRKALVVMQSFFAVGLIIATVNLFHQINFLSQLPVGYAKDGRIEVRDIDAAKLFDAQSTGLLTALANIDGVSSVTPFDRSLSEGPGGGMDIIYPNDPSVKHEVSFSGSGYHVVKTLGLNLLAGRDFAPEFAGDWFHTNEQKVERAGIIVTESMLKQAGIETPEDAIGQVFKLSENHKEHNAQVTVVGVVEDIKLGSVKDSYAPLFFICGYSWAEKATVVMELNSRQTARVKGDLSTVFSEYLSVDYLDIRLSKDNYDSIYRYERRQAQLVVTFCGAAIFLTCFGVFGMASYSTRSRSKEIAIRKALGAGKFHLINMIAKEQLLLTAISVVLAVPVAFYIISDWLSNFNQRISQSVLVYLLAIIAVSLITWITVAAASYRIASNRPSAVLHQD